MLTLSITGQVIRASNIELSMNYSIDGQESLLLPITEQARSQNDQYMGLVVGSVELQKLSNGSHDITVFGDLKANGVNYLAQAQVYFTIDSNPD
jgi:hypothetical protein